MTTELARKKLQKDGCLSWHLMHDCCLFAEIPGRVSNNKCENFTTLEQACVPLNLFEPGIRCFRTVLFSRVALSPSVEMLYACPQGVVMHSSMEDKAIVDLYDSSSGVYILRFIVAHAFCAHHQK